ncbi:hypothetical protein PR003_g9372 [Phytophthora rubi]|uniref:Uncharacterized protein n=1 Tax=Phytophthora rubi TaxID=129364 RepID=A0A6A4FGY3_9STRA|nr:hypothetical protein PR003_g9372 [Phytophthora rubi]
MSINGWSVEDVYETVRGFGFRGRCLTLLLAMVHFLFVLAIPLLCCLKADNLLFSLLFADGKLYAFAKELLLLVVQVFIALKLDEVVHWSLVKVLAPYFAYEALNLLETVAGGVLGHHMLVNDTVGASFTETAAIEEERRMLVKAVVRKTIMTALRIAQAVLIGMKVDHNLNATSWWRVMTPVWILVAYLCWYPIKKYINSTSAHRLLDAVFTAGIIVMLVAPFFLLADRLEGKRMSSFDIIMPWMLLMGVSFLFLFCAISLAGSEQLIPSGVQPTRRHTQSPPYRHDYVAVDMD